MGEVGGQVIYFDVFHEGYLKYNTQYDSKNVKSIRLKLSSRKIILKSEYFRVLLCIINIFKIKFILNYMTLNSPTFIKPARDKDWYSSLLSTADDGNNTLTSANATVEVHSSTTHELQSLFAMP